MSRFSLNLARRPFVNQRPVVRLAVLSWIVGVGLTAVNGWLYFGYWTATASQSSGLVEANQRIASAQAGLAAAETALAGLDLAQQNQRAVYLNDRIAERTLSWSRLFDDLAAVLPRQVRLYSVAPQRSRERERAPGDTSPSEPTAILVQLRGAGETTEAVLELVDALFGHPSFAAPDLRREAHAASGLTEFDLQVSYRPQPTTSPAAVEAAATRGSAAPNAEALVAEPSAGVVAPAPSVQATVPAPTGATSEPLAGATPLAPGVSSPATARGASGWATAPSATPPTFFSRALPVPLAAPASATRRLP